MRRMTVDEIHGVCLEVLEHIHSFCQKRGIRYGLAYGTLLGAVRHKGFIPWDDDADILMPREDYDRFVREYQDSEDFQLFAFERGNAALTYARVCEMKRTYFKQGMIWTLESPGIGIDVFPFDYVPEDAESFNAVVKTCSDNMERVWSARAGARFVPEYWRLSLNNDFVRNIKNLCHIVLRIPKATLSRIRVKRECRKYLHFLKSQLNGQTRRCGNCSLPKYKVRESIPVEWIENYTKLELCGRKFFVPTHWHEILANYYGDYMTPPSRNRRETHVGCQSMWWR